MHTKLWMIAFAMVVGGLAGCTTAPEEAGEPTDIQPVPTDDGSGVDTTDDGASDAPMDDTTTDTTTDTGAMDDGTGAADDGTMDPGMMDNETMDPGMMDNASSDQIVVAPEDGSEPAPVEGQDTADGGADTTV